MTQLPTDPPYHYHLTYSGTKLPLKLVKPLSESEIGNRNTFFRSRADTQGRLILVEKIVHGAVELSHRYSYRDDGALLSAEITQGDDEPSVLSFDEQGMRMDC